MINTVISLMHAHCHFSALGALMRCVLSAITRTCFYEKQPAHVAAEISPHPAGKACASMTLGCPLSTPGASPLSMPQKWHKCSLLCACHPWTDMQGSSRALLQGGCEQTAVGDHLRPDPMIAGDLLASLVVHGVLHSQRDVLVVGGSDCTHPLFTDSNHGFTCFFEKTTKVLKKSKICWAILIFGRKYLVGITKCLKK